MGKRFVEYSHAVRGTSTRKAGEFGEGLFANADVL